MKRTVVDLDLFQIGKNCRDFLLGFFGVKLIDLSISDPSAKHARTVFETDAIQMCDKTAMGI